MTINSFSKNENVEEVWFYTQEAFRTLSSRLEVFLRPCWQVKPFYWTSTTWKVKSKAKFRYSSNRSVGSKTSDDFSEYPVCDWLVFTLSSNQRLVHIYWPYICRCSCRSDGSSSASFSWRNLVRSTVKSSFLLFALKFGTFSHLWFSESHFFLAVNPMSEAF